MNQTFMKEKPVFPLLLSMGIPMILSMMASSLYNIVDSIFVARISDHSHWRRLFDWHEFCDRAPAGRRADEGGRGSRHAGAVIKPASRNPHMDPGVAGCVPFPPHVYR